MTEETPTTNTARFRQLYQETPGMMHCIDAQARLLFVNIHWLTKLGYERDEVLGRSLADFLTVESRDRLFGEHLTSFRLGQDYVRLEYQMVHKDGQLIDVMVSDIAQRNAEGDFVKGTAIIEDVTARKAVEEALRASESFLERTGAVAGVGGFRINLLTGEHSWTRQTFRIHGLQGPVAPTLKELDGMFDADVRATLQAALATAVSSGKGYDIEAPMVTADGRAIWIRVLGEVEYRNGRPAFVSGAIQDITDRKTAEQALRSSQEFLDRAGSIAGVGAWSYDVRSGALYWSSETCRIHARPLGHKPTLEEALSHYPGPSRVSIESAVDTCITEGVPFDLELAFVSLDGVLKWVRAVGESEWKGGRSVRLFGAFQDITARKHAAAHLQEQHELLRVTLDSIGEAVITTDSHGTVQWLNPVAGQLTGWSGSDGLGLPIGQVFHTIDRLTRLPINNPATRALAEDGPVVLMADTILIARAGDEVGIEASASPIRAKDGSCLGTVLVFHDVSERQRTAEALRSANERLGMATEAACIGVWDFDVRANSVRCDAEMCRIYGLPAGSLDTFEHWAVNLHPDDREATQRAVASALSGEKNYDTEFRIIRPDGEIRYVKAAGKVRRDSTDAPLLMVGINVDITERKRAEAAVAESSNHARALYEVTSAIIDQHELDELLQTLVEAVAEALPADRVTLITFDLKAQCVTHFAKGGPGSALVVQVPFDELSHGLSGWVLRTGLPALSSKKAPDPREEPDAQQRRAETHCGDILVVPVGYKGHIIGTLTAINTPSGAEFQQKHVALMTATAGHVAVAISNISLFRELKDNARALQVTTERLTLATDAAGIGVWEWDLTSNGVNWDHHMYRLYGIDHPGGEAAYEIWTARLHPEDLARAEQELHLAVRDGAPFDTEFRIITPVGAVRHIRGVAQLQRDAAGAPQRMVGVNFDVTQRKEAELKLQHTSALLHTVLDSAADICIIARMLDDTITVFNKGAERLLGYTSAEVITTPSVLSIHDPAEIQARAAELSTLVGRHVACSDVFKEPSSLNSAREWTYIRKDLRRVPVSLIVSPMVAQAGQLIGYMGIARDITEEREQRSALQHATLQAERANAAKSQFLANMSHEIRTPLNAVIGLGYLLEQTPLSLEQRSFLRKINFAGRSLLGVVNNVLDVSKIEAGEMILEEADFDLRELAQQVGQMLNPEAQAKGIELRVHSLPGLPRRVRGDEARLRQVMTNLVNNAIKFTERGHVELELSAIAQQTAEIRLRCAVRDTGIGIPSETLSRLFMPFAQADSSTTRRFGGTGLGLSIARNFVELMGGEIGVESEVGAGTEFWIEVPLRTAAAGGSDITSDTARALQILIVQNPTDTNRLDSIVVPFGWKSYRVQEPEKAIIYMRNRHGGAWPDLILFDVRLPETDAAIFASRLRHEFPYQELPPIVAVLDSAIGMREPQPPLLQQGVSAVLAHPVTSSALFNAVNAVLATRAGDHASVMQATQFDQAGMQWLPGTHILVVDDSDINREVAQHILTKQGAAVTTSCNGVQALERLRQTPEAFDIVLMDVQMPEMDGNEATERIRKELGLITLPIIALTAGALLSERERSIAAGMDDFLSKPLEPVLLIRAVRRFVEKTRGDPIPVSVGGHGRASSVVRGFSNIDSAVVQRVFGNDGALFASLLSRLLHDYGDLSLPISMDTADAWCHQETKARMHKLRGSAGSIGATRVEQSAAAAERALEGDQPAEFVEAILRQVAAALTALGEEARPVLDAHAAQGTAALADVTASSPADNDAIARLLAMLDDHNLGAMDHFKDIATSMNAALGEARFVALREAIERLDFFGAAQVLRNANQEARRMSVR